MFQQLPRITNRALKKTHRRAVHLKHRLCGNFLNSVPVLSVRGQIALASLHPFGNRAQVQSIPIPLRQMCFAQCVQSLLSHRAVSEGESQWRVDCCVATVAQQLQDVYCHLPLSERRIRKDLFIAMHFVPWPQGKKALSEESKSLQLSNIFKSPVPNIQFSKNILRRIVCCFVFTCDYRIFSVICFGVKYSIPLFRNILEVFLGVSI